MANSRILKKTGRVLLYILCIVVLLVCLLIFFINTPYGKTTVKNQVQSFLRSKLKTHVVIGSVDYSLPKFIEINNVYIEDQFKDTLIFGEQITADLSMFKLIRGNTDIDKLFFKNILINVNRPENDSTFNFQFVLDAFTGNKPATQVDVDTAALKLSLDHLIFDNVVLRFNDVYGGSHFSTSIKALDATLDIFQPDKMRFAVKDFTASGVDFFMRTVKNSPDSNVVKISNDSVTVSQNGLFLTAGNIDLRDVNVTVDNFVDGMHYSNKVKHLALINTVFDMNRSTGTADKLQLDSSYIHFKSPATTTVTDTSVTTENNWYFKVPDIQLRNNHIVFNDVNAPRTDGLDFMHLNTRDLNLFAGISYSKDSIGAFIQGMSFRDTSGFILDSLQARILFTDSALSASNVFLKTPGTSFYNETMLLYNGVASLTSNPGQSNVNAKIINSTLAMNDLYMLVPALATSFPKEEFKDLSLFINTELRGNLARLYLPFFQLHGLTGSKVNGSGYLMNITDPQRLAYDIKIVNSTIARNDLMKFVPSENKAEAAKLPAVFNVSTHVKGTATALAADLRISGGDFRYSGIVALNNIDDPARMNYNISIRDMQLNRNFISTFIPAGTLPANIVLPQSISGSGKFKGSSTGFDADISLNSSYGKATVAGYLKNMDNPANALYDLHITTDGFNVGALLQDTTLGTATVDVYAKGRGFDYKTMRSDITASIAQIEFNGYNYRNADIVADFNNGSISGTGSIKDSSLSMNFSGNADVSGQYPTFDALVRVDTAQLQKLNFYNEPLDFSFTADLKSTSLQPGSMNASALLDSIRIHHNDERYALDTVSLIATSKNGIDDIRFRSELADLTATGDFEYDKVADAVMQYVDHYYNIGDFGTATSQQQIAVDGKIKPHPLVSAFVPGLTDYDTISFNGAFSSANTDSALSFNALIPYVSIDGNDLRNGDINISSRNERINYAITFDTLHYVAQTFHGTSLNGSLANDSVSLIALTQDNAKRDWFGLNASLYFNDPVYTFRLNDNLLLNYENWAVQPDNFISYSDQGILVNNFMMRSDTASISINSLQPVANSPIDVVIDNFNIKSITSFLSTDTLLATGVLDAKLSVTDLNKAIPGFTGNANLANFTILTQPMGDVNFTAQKVTDNDVAATFTLTGQGNNIISEGNYYLNNTEQQFDANVDIIQLNLGTLARLSQGALREASGNISGKLALEGKLSNPIWNGELNFDNARFASTQLGAPYIINNQQIVFEYPDINFNNFKVQDSLNHELVIDGSITSNTLTNYDLDLYLNTADFIILNAPKAIDNSFYGFASVDANLSISGNSETPEIEGDLFVDDESDVTIIIPEQSINKDAARTVIRFVDEDTFAIDPPKILFEPADIPQSNFGRFLNYNLNISITKEATLTIIVDPATGDELRVKGDAQLNAGVDPGGNLILAGNYELEEGHYVLNYQFLQRRFNLQKGGTIFFVGEPMSARIDLTAEYIANTSSKDLLANEVSSVSPDLANSFNQQIPFRVILKLTGVLSRPEINFDIMLPEEDAPINSELRTTVENKLAQMRGDQAATNKQVFSLLLFNRFVGEQSSDFFKGNGSDFNDLARQSVSQFLSSALDEIASDLFKGIDIDLNLNTYRDYNNGGNQQRTDLNVAVSKSFMDDRLVVSVGTNIGIEGQDPAAKAGGSAGFMPDVTFAYKLTKDGRYMIRAYRKNQFEVVLDGYVVENGVGFIVTMNYEKFRELFQRRKK